LKQGINPTKQKQIKMKTYKFHTDPGHGWLEVPTLECHDLGILSKISSYSYRGRNNEGIDCLYLEEDCDFAIFHEAKGGKENYNMEQIYHKYEAPCRNFRSFNQ
jgi:hypothetical protein